MIRLQVLYNAAAVVSTISTPRYIVNSIARVVFTSESKYKYNHHADKQLHFSQKNKHSFFLLLIFLQKVI